MTSSNGSLSDVIFIDIAYQLARKHFQLNALETIEQEVLALTNCIYVAWIKIDNNTSMQPASSASGLKERYKFIEKLLHEF